MRQRQRPGWQVANIGALILTLVANYLANALPLNGQTTGQISDRFPVRFVPAGYVFAIWGLIYAGLIAFVVYQVLPAQRENRRLARIGPWFVVNCLANAVWIFLWHYNYFAISVPVIALILISLVVIHRRLNIGREQVSNVERLVVDAPLSIYTGWLTVATIANATVTLYALGWNGWGISAEVWAALLLVVATGIATAFTWGTRDWLYILVPLWAFVGIAVKHADAPVVAVVALVMAAVVGAVFVLTALNNRRGGRFVTTAA